MRMKIAKLAPSNRVEGRWLCCLEDGTILRLSMAEIADFGLYAGLELSGETRGALEGAVEERQVKEKALELLSRRPMSRKELVDKLSERPRDKEKKALPRETAEKAADRLEELGYLTDAEYAKTVARHYSAKGYGQGRIREELWKRGVPREFWEEAGEEAAAPEEGIDAFLARRFRKGPPDEKERRRAADALARRGYRWEEIRDGLRRYGETEDQYE